MLAMNENCRIDNKEKLLSVSKTADEKTEDSDSTSTINNTSKRIKDLESLIEKKFNSNKQDEQAMIKTSRKKSIDDDDSKNSIDSKTSSQTDFKMNDDYNYEDSDDKQEEKEYDDYEFEDDDEHNDLTKMSSNFDENSKYSLSSNQLNKLKCDESELKALNEFIRSNTNFKFERLENDKKFDPDSSDNSTNQETNLELDYDHDYNQSELENEENIRKIIQLCKHKFPELKYKITKCVKTIFKEKFRVAYKKNEDKIRLGSEKTKLAENAELKFNQPANKIISSKANQATNDNQSSRLSNNTIFKPQELKTKNNESSSIKQTMLANSSPQSSSPSSTFKHSINNLNSDLKSKKFKSGSSHSAPMDTKNEDYNGKSIINNKSTENLKSLHSIHSSSSMLSNATSSSSFDKQFLNSNLFNPSSASSSPIISSQLMSTSTNPLVNPSIPPSQLFDPEIMRLAAAAAAANPLFRFPDFNALNNPYFNSLSNLFRSSLPNPSSSSPISQFGLSSPAASFSTASPGSTSTQSLSLPVSSLTSSSNMSNSFNNNNSKSLISPTSKNNGNFFSPNHHSSSHHCYQSTEQSTNDKSSHNNSKHSTNSSSISSNSSVHKSQSNNQTNGESKHTNGNSNNGSNITNSISSYILSSSKLKLNSKFSKLTSTEIQTVKSLINGYRESAAFLNRTVEELEQLLSNETNETDSK